MRGVATVQAMTEQLTRIGRGVPGARKPYRKISSLVLAGAIMLAALVMLTVALIVNRDDPPAAAPQVPVASATIDVKGACAVLVPVLSTGADVFVDIAEKPDGSTVDWAGLEATIRDLQAIRPITPVDMHQDIQSQIDPLIELKQRHDGVLAGNGTMNLAEFRASGLRLGARCAQFAS